MPTYPDKSEVLAPSKNAHVTQASPNVSSTVKRIKRASKATKTKINLYS